MFTEKQTNDYMLKKTKILLGQYSVIVFVVFIINLYFHTKVKAYPPVYWSRV